jgi:hypothetical protein
VPVNGQEQAAFAKAMAPKAPAPRANS